MALTQSGLEPLVASLGLLGALIGQEVWQVSKLSKNDSLLFEQFLSEFPSNGRSARFLESHDIGGSFRDDELKELDKFAESWGNADHEFGNKRLEAQRKELLQATEKFRTDLSLNVFAGSHGFLTMDLKDYEDRPELLATRERLNNLAMEVFKQHQELVRLGRKLT